MDFPTSQPHPLYLDNIGLPTAHIYADPPHLYREYLDANPTMPEPTLEMCLQCHFDHAGVDAADAEQAGWRIREPLIFDDPTWVLIPVTDAGNVLCVHGVRLRDSHSGHAVLSSLVAGAGSAALCPTVSVLDGPDGAFEEGAPEFHMPAGFERGLLDSECVFATDNPFTALALRSWGITACSFLDPCASLGTVDGLRTLIDHGLLTPRSRPTGTLILIDSLGSLDAAGARRLRGFFRTVYEAPTIHPGQVRLLTDALPPYLRASSDHALDLILQFVDETGIQHVGRPLALPLKVRSATTAGGSGGFVGMDEIANDASMSAQWIIPGLAAVGCITDVIGEPKAGKSSLCLAGCNAVARGVKFLSRQCAQGSVLYVTEQPTSSFKSTLERSGWDGRGGHVLTFGEHCGLSFDEILETVRRAVHDKTPILIVFDTLPAIAGMGEGANSSGVVEPVFAKLRQLCELGVGVITMRHSNKAAVLGGIANVVRSGAGSQAYAGAADIVALLSFCDGGSNRRSLTTIGRLGEPDDATVVFQDGVYSVVASGAKKSPDPTSAPAKPSSVERNAELILRILSEAKSPLSVAEVITRCAAAPGRSPKRGAADRALQRLVDAGEVERTRQDGHGIYLYFRRFSPSAPGGSDEK